jgi:RNA polymerase sigma-70 factor (ECF subfamily)
MKDLSGPPQDGSGELPRPERDADAVARVLAGDAQAFRLLVETHEPAVFGLCRRLLCGNAADAEDVTQETFLRAYRYLARLEDRARFAPWLYQIARSLARERRRHQDVERRALAERAERLRRTLRARDDEPSEPVLGKALEDLPAEEREALVLRYFEGLSYEDVSKRLRLSFSRVDHLIRKARARLARRLHSRERVESS